MDLLWGFAMEAEEGSQRRKCCSARAPLTFLNSADVPISFGFRLLVCLAGALEKIMSPTCHIRTKGEETLEWFV
jgi:hypothetical protein